MSIFKCIKIHTWGLKPWYMKYIIHKKFNKWRMSGGVREILLRDSRFVALARMWKPCFENVLKSARRTLHAIACILFSLGCISNFIERALAFIKRGDADIHTRSSRGFGGCVQQNSQGFARLRYLHCYLPRQRATRAVLQQIITRCRVCKTGNDVITGNNKLV